MLLPILAAILFLAGLALLWLAWRRQKAAGLPSGRIIYNDSGAGERVEEPLYDAALGLVGRPDYLIEQGELLIPVEVKSGRAAEAPYDGHIYQLASYCLLVERVYGKRPTHGILRYANRTFAIDYTQDLEASLLALLEEMHAQERRKEVDRSHESPARCRACGFRSVCDQRMA